MPNINLDLREVIEEMQLTEDTALQLSSFVLEKVTVSIFENWRIAAGQRLKSTRQEYVNGLQIISEGVLKNAIVLHGKLPNMLEQGASPFDMKEGLLNSSRVKINKKGKRYLSVPFRFSTPSALGESSSFSGALPTQVHKAIRKSATGTLPGKDVPSPFDQLKTRAALPGFPAYQHKSSIYAGLVNTGKVNHSQYRSWRTVSESGSDKDSWIHKGFAPYNIATTAINMTDVSSLTERSIDEFLDNF